MQVVVNSLDLISNHTMFSDLQEVDIDCCMHVQHVCSSCVCIIHVQACSLSPCVCIYWRAVYQADKTEPSINIRRTLRRVHDRVPVNDVSAKKRCQLG